MKARAILQRWRRARQLRAIKRELRQAVTLLDAHLAKQAEALARRERRQRETVVGPSGLARGGRWPESC